MYCVILYVDYVTLYVYCVAVILYCISPYSSLCNKSIKQGIEYVEKLSICEQELCGCYTDGGIGNNPVLLGVPIFL